MRLARAIAPLLLLTLTQCGTSLVTPFETVPPPESREEMLMIESGIPLPRVAICYNAAATTAAQVRALAAARCAGGTVPHAMSRDFDLSACPLFVPERATFSCAKS
jgi:hypothetical protein